MNRTPWVGRVAAHPSRTQIVGAAVLASAALGPAWGAGSTEFNPSLALGTTYTDNVEYIELDIGGTTDSTMTLGLTLPVTRRFRNGTLNFSYNPSFTRYGTYDQLDHDDQRADFGVTVNPDRFSSFSFSVGYSETQQQGDASAVDTEGFLLSAPTRRTAYLGRMLYERKLGSRWRIDTSANASRHRYERVEGIAPIDPDLDNIEDKSGLGGALGVAWTATRRLSVGASYGYQQYELQETGDEQVHRFGLTLEQIFTPTFSIGLLVGGYRRSEDVPEGVTASEGPTSGLDARLDIRYDRPVGNVRLGFDVGVSPSSGGALAGSSVDRTAAFRVSQANERSRWIWSAASRYTERKPNDSSLPTVRTVGLGGSVERSLGELLGLRGGLTLADQSARGGTTRNVDGRYYTAAVQLVWYPLGRRRARGSSDEEA